MEDNDTKYAVKFNLNPDESVIIEKYGCMYFRNKIPIIGNLYIFNDHVCYSSNVGPIASIKIVIKIKNIIFCELMPKTLGVAISLTTIDMD